ncbi:type II toxin-antitoxin system RelE family toxin [Crocosphaera sp.]|uniref:type II toxin-antitoxin system RelE family toxin n=1 Tax=Crocosphaera sp. TaxID=2729996 RepID=UPI003F1F18C2
MIEKTEQFEKSFKKLVKSYKSKSQQVEFVNFISNYLDEITNNPYPNKSRSESLPNGLKLPQEWVLYKLRIMFAKGASGQIRMLYLVNEQDRIIKPLWIYSHKQFAKRPPEQDIKTVIKQLF